MRSCLYFCLVIGFIYISQETLQNIVIGHNFKAQTIFLIISATSIYGREKQKLSKGYLKTMLKLGFGPVIRLVT